MNKTFMFVKPQGLGPVKDSQYLSRQKRTYKRVSYSLNMMRNAACLVINPTDFLNCTPVDRASDNTMAPN